MCQMSTAGRLYYGVYLAPFPPKATPPTIQWCEIDPRFENATYQTDTAIDCGPIVPPLSPHSTENMKFARPGRNSFARVVAAIMAFSIKNPKQAMLRND